MGSIIEAMSTAILSNLPAVILLVLGFVLVVIEMYVPGFGLPGISGIVCLVVGVVLKAQNAVEALVLAVVIIALLCIALSISIRSVSKGRLAKSKLVLHETATKAENISANDMEFYLGRKGITKTVLRPAGIGEFDGVKLSIVSDGEFIGAGETVVVKAVEGNRIVVAIDTEQ